MNTIKAGVGRVTITPPVGMYLPGMERMEDSHGLRDDVYATALSISDADQEVVIVSLDALLVHPEFVARVRRQANEQTGIPPENLMFCATHCHSGPVTQAYENSRPIFRAYVDNLAYLLTGLIRMAHDNLAPAQLGYGTGNSSIGINRRLTKPDGTTIIAANPEGPVDHQVGVLRVDDAVGQPIAIIANYACHPVVLGNGSNVISADWPGAMRRTVERESGAKLLFIQGAAADINPWPGEPTDSGDILERLGTSIGGEVLSVWARLQTQKEGRVQALQEKIWLPLQPVSQYSGKTPDFVELEEAVGEMSLEQFQAWLEELMPWSAELQGDGDLKKVAMELQAFKIGDVALVSAGGEIFVETGLAVKQRSPLNSTMFAGYSNGSVGYIPLPEDFPRGGYEVYEAYLGYRLPAPVAPEAAGLIEDHAVELLSRLTGS